MHRPGTLPAANPPTLPAPSRLKQIIMMKPPKGGWKCLDLNSSISEFTFLSKKVQLLSVGILVNLNFTLLIVKCASRQKAGGAGGPALDVSGVSGANGKRPRLLLFQAH